MELVEVPLPLFDDGHAHCSCRGSLQQQEAPAPQQAQLDVVEGTEFSRRVGRRIVAGRRRGVAEYRRLRPYDRRIPLHPPSHPDARGESRCGDRQYPHDQDAGEAEDCNQAHGGRHDQRDGECDPDDPEHRGPPMPFPRGRGDDCCHHRDNDHTDDHAPQSPAGNRTDEPGCDAQVDAPRPDSSAAAADCAGIGSIGAGRPHHVAHVLSPLPRFSIASFATELRASACTGGRVLASSCRGENGSGGSRLHAVVRPAPATIGARLIPAG
jgi:hypothetical protein